MSANFRILVTDRQAKHTATKAKPGGVKRIQKGRAMNLEILASQMNLSPAEAVALPATIEAAAKSAGLDIGTMLVHCEAKPALRDYLAGICREVA